MARLKQGMRMVDRPAVFVRVLPEELILIRRAAIRARLSLQEFALKTLLEKASHEGFAGTSGTDSPTRTGRLHPRRNQADSRLPPVNRGGGSDKYEAAPH